MKIQMVLATASVILIGCSDSKRGQPPVSGSEAVHASASHPGELAKQESLPNRTLGARDEALAKLITDHETAQRAHIAEIRAAGRDAEKANAARDTYRKHNFPQQFLDFAIANDDDASLAACQYVITKFYISDLRYSAIDHVVKYHLNNDRIDRFFRVLSHGYAADRAADACFKAGMMASRKSTRALASYELALLNLQRRDWCLDSADEREIYVDALGKDAVDRLLSQEGADEIAELLEQIIADYPDERYFDWSLSERAGQSLFALRNLEVGCEIPAVEGKDSAGRTLRIRDNRGNVVVVCFWAHWCGVCMESLPRETQFVASMEGRPFVWLGVNGDDDIELLREAERAEKVNFSSWHDGREGAIATQWNIWGFPALFVIDQDGIVCYKSRGHVELDVVFPIIEELVANLEAERADGITK